MHACLLRPRANVKMLIFGRRINKNMQVVQHCVKTLDPRLDPGSLAYSFALRGQKLCVGAIPKLRITEPGANVLAQP